MYLPRFLADRTNGGAYATVVLRPSPAASSSSVNCRLVEISSLLIIFLCFS